MVLPTHVKEGGLHIIKHTYSWMDWEGPHCLQNVWIRNLAKHNHATSLLEFFATQHASHVSLVLMTMNDALSEVAQMAKHTTLNVITTERCSWTGTVSVHICRWHARLIGMHHPYIWQHFDAARLSVTVCFIDLNISEISCLFMYRRFEFQCGLCP